MAAIALEDYGDTIYATPKEQPDNVLARAEKTDGRSEFRWTVRWADGYELCRTKPDARRKLRAKAAEIADGAR